jgi:hypothetical protein
MHGFAIAHSNLRGLCDKMILGSEHVNLFWTLE